MNTYIYEEYLPDTAYKDDLVKIDRFFERYYNDYIEISSSDNDNYLVHHLNDIKNKLYEEEIINKIQKIRKYTREYKFARPVFNSYSQNLAQFLNMNTRDTKSNKIKWRKVLCNTFSFTRILLSVQDFYNIINGKITGDLQLVLGVKDCKGEYIGDILQSVRDEIDNIILLSKKSSDKAVLPVLECSTNVYKRLISIASYNGLHIAGHGNSDFIPFSDSNLKLNKFIDTLSDQTFDFSIFNCCYSYEFLNKNGLNNCNYSVVHKGTVKCANAEQFSNDFYNNYYNGCDVYRSLNNALTLNSSDYILI